jgi:hypothetical protein
MMETVKGKIAAILDRTTVVVNRGFKDGVARNDIFWIYSEIGPFFDPDTKENLGTSKRIWGKVVVSSVEERFCIAKTEYQTKNISPLAGLANLFGTTIEQIKLPVEESQISRDLTKIEIGFKAILEKHQEKLTEKNVKTLPPKPINSLKAAGKEQPSKENSDVPE